MHTHRHTHSHTHTNANWKPQLRSDVRQQCRDCCQLQRLRSILLCCEPNPAIDLRRQYLCDAENAASHMMNRATVYQRDGRTDMTHRRTDKQCEQIAQSTIESITTPKNITSCFPSRPWSTSNQNKQITSIFVFYHHGDANGGIWSSPDPVRP